ncbi:hypothetical protein Pmani_002938 [Petrolisthes manimaculis]|uniref:UDP-N-acetylglucosamine--dolichyl-phosphate N-acetylglucosaminephosphotransferase n=1 Tax=Petrolisthes manimaculis TaxID=1843537 RepID=A0AAE1QHL1_9EUCA|nr:hypothetical protein Pmani_002938 [Petrolisthes manimaculis]
MVMAVSAIMSQLAASVTPNGMAVSLAINAVISVVGGVMVARTIPAVTFMFLKAGLSGRDLCKPDKESKVPESMGLVTGCVFLIVMFLFLGVAFGQHFLNPTKLFPHAAFSEYLTSLLCICCMLLLGFADDVLNLKWRYKLVLPTVASLPLLMVYYVNLGSTTVVMPKLLRPWIGLTLNIGPLYYIYMAMLAVFCTNTINIYAGINGLESGQTVVAGASVALFNIIELSSSQAFSHYFSLCLLLPFIATSLALYYHNRYPARAFVGDTFTYFSGMTFAVVAIIGHFSKTVLLFFMPQIFNFLYSIPQLFRLVPCPRHRLPRYNEKLDKVEASEAEINESEMRWWVLAALKVLHRLKLVHLRRGTGPDSGKLFINNLTLINLTLLWSGPCHEGTLTNTLLILQILSSALAFVIRYPLADLFF